MDGDQLRDRADRARQLARSMTTDAARDEFLTIATELEARAKLADEVGARRE